MPLPSTDDTNLLKRFEPSLRPPIWARGGHAQTLLGYYLGVAAPTLTETAPGVRRRDVPLLCGDTLVVFDAEPLEGAGPLEGPGLPSSTALPSSTESAEVTATQRLGGITVHLFHGLTGSSESNYMRLAAQALRRAGAQVRLFNHRGQGAGEGRARGLYHSGSDEDLFSSIADARRSGDGRVHVAVGFSLSANTLLLGLARRADHPGTPDAALAVNPPVDLASCVDRIARGVNRVYDRNFVAGMRAALRVRQDKGWFDPSVRIPRGASVRAADDLVTAPAAGYASADDYYADCSSGPRLAMIDRPAAILTSADDPFIDPSEVVEAARDSSVHVHIEPTGGHLGYLGRGRERWLAPALVHYVDSLRRAVVRG